MENQGRYYLTKEGLERFKKEHEDLCHLRKSMTEGDVPSILHSEDIDPEYLAFQEDMMLLEGRIAERDSILRNYEIICRPKKSERDKVYLGATVTLTDLSDGSVNEYTIIGTLEANSMEGKISSDSPVGKAMLGKGIGEEVVITSPIRVVYKVRDIRYVIV